MKISTREQILKALRKTPERTVAGVAELTGISITRLHAMLPYLFKQQVLDRFPDAENHYRYYIKNDAVDKQPPPPPPQAPNPTWRDEMDWFLQDCTIKELVYARERITSMFAELATPC